MADEKFSLSGVSMKMNAIEDSFAAFSDTLNAINSFVETNVNASLASSAYGDLGGKLLALWDHNSATFEDFHENFDQWSQVVAVISANNNEFAVNAQPTYRDNVGTLDGVKEAREFAAKNNGVSNAADGEGYGSLSNDAKDIINGVYRTNTETTQNNNTYGGKTVTYTDADGNKITIYYDGEGNIVGKDITDKSGNTKHYNRNGEEIDKQPTNDEYQDAREKKKEEIEKMNSYYENHLDNLKWGSYELCEYTAENGLTIKYWIYKPDYGRDVTGVPTMMYVHGGGNDNSMSTINSYGLPKYISDKSQTPEGVVIVPFIKNFSDSRNLEALKELTDKVVSENNGDPNKISISGHSNGAKTTYQMINKYPDYYAAAVPISGSMPITSDTKTKIWGFGGEYDHGDMSGTARQQSIINNYVSNGGTGKVQVLERRGHSYTQDDTYNGTYVSPDGDETSAYKWASRQSKA